jgi:hypothetical protein
MGKILSQTGGTGISMKRVPIRQMLTALMREPFTAFLLLGGIIFLLFDYLDEPAWEPIRVTPAIVEELVSGRAEVLGRAVTETEKDQLIEQYINNEVLWREAVAMELYKQDGEVRRRLIDKMNYLLERDPGEPTLDDLNALYAAQPEAYLIPPLTSFEHVYFKVPVDNAFTTLEELRNGQDPSSVGDTFWLGNRLEDYDSERIAALFGAKFEQVLQKLTTGEWVGPIVSIRGQHLVRVTSRRKAEILPQRALQQRLKSDWIGQHRWSHRMEQLNKLRSGYEIEYSTGDSD